MKVYVASSWRNKYQPDVVALLRENGHEVYDFRNPEAAFKWDDIDPGYESWTTIQYMEALENPLAAAGFERDFSAMEWADAFVLVMPCGRSAHLEAGWAIGAGKPTFIYIPEESEPELMYKMASAIVSTTEKLVDLLSMPELTMLMEDGSS